MFRNSFTQKMFVAKRRKEREKGVRKEEERCSETVSLKKCLWIKGEKKERKV